MTTPIKTQCPHCQACFKLQQTQLNKVNATVCCDQCQQSFLVNKHLIVTTDTPPKIADSTTTNPNNTSNVTPLTHNKLSNKQSSAALSSDSLIHDDLIYDDMDIDDADESSLEYDSLENMDAWLTHATDSSHTNSIASNKLDKTPKSAAQSASAATQSTSPAQVALSSAAANNIHANIDDTTDNAWLEDLLKEQNKNDNSIQEDTDLSQLLLSMGVPFRDEDRTHEERVKKMQAQAKFAPTPARHSIASLLWTLGCLVLALLLFAQYVIFNLETLVKNPAHAERLQTICTIAACSLPSADLSALTITELNHKPSQIKKTGTFSEVSATLNNQSPQAQLYPNVKVSVYGTDALLGEFIAAPDDYLLSTQNQIAADSRRQLLFTIPVANAQIREVRINPIY
ncbi:DUF3426 domain-containing protein [Psychrobacter okhotskensis]|uniref:DUF3426 domain-containing protein n=1 Tax=Psychrobacter okhotskensis TaxID=212403 RepID=UPI001917FA83|nr:DUF3426 domain-containing protein [Psychrobacter okhotskensis]